MTMDNTAPPLPDSRMANFIGLGGPEHSGYHVLAEQAASWPTTEATPEGPAGLLSTSRDCYAQGYYAYSLFVVAGAWATIAVEAALRVRLSADEKRPFAQLVKDAEAQGLIAGPGWDAERLDYGRKLRNRLAHGQSQGVWPPVVSRGIVLACHQAVAMLFP